MKSGFIKITATLIAVSLLFSSCLVGDSEDIPNFSEQLQRDLAEIDAWLAEKNIDAKQDPEGWIRYVIHENSIGGNSPTIDSCVTAHYKGVLLSNGSKFDEKTASFPLQSVIDGWKIGIPLLSEGDSATLYIPSGLAYGYYGLGSRIPRNANLVFNVRLKNVGSKYNSTDFSCN